MQGKLALRIHGISSTKTKGITSTTGRSTKPKRMPEKTGRREESLCNAKSMSIAGLVRMVNKSDQKIYFGNVMILQSCPRFTSWRVSIGRRKELQSNASSMTISFTIFKS